MPTEINMPKAEIPSPYPQRIPWQSSQAAVVLRSRWTWRCLGGRTASGCAPPVGISFSGPRKAYPYTSSLPPPFPSACTYRGTPRQSYPRFKKKKQFFVTVELHQIYYHFFWACIYSCIPQQYYLSFKKKPATVCYLLVLCLLQIIQ